MSEADLRPRIALCGWCRTELPDSGDWIKDAPEVQHHFFIAHNIAVGHSITYVYLDDLDRLLALPVREHPEGAQQ